MITAQIVVVGLAALFIVWPWLPHRRQTERELAGVEQIRREANIALYREQREQLDEQRATGELDEPSYAQQLEEIGELLVANADGAAPVNAPARVGGGWLAMVLLAALALAVWAGYRHYGAELDLTISAELAALDAVGDEDRSAQLAKLELLLWERLARNPDSAYYWNLLAQRALGAGDFAAAAERYGRAVEWADEEGWLYAQYAQALFFAANRQFTEAVNLALDRGYALAPDDQTVLGLKGVQAFELGEHRAAIDYWRRAQSALSPQSTGWQALQSGIERSAALLDEITVAQPSADTDAGSEASTAIAVSIALAEGVPRAPGQVVFVAVVQADGPPMPIAAQRLAAEQLPLTVTLTERDQLSSGRTLAGSGPLVVSVRLSATGTATPSDGDRVVRSAPFLLPVGGIELALTLGDD
jgi:cytochrome c-type biogenesis protein CcmH